MEAPKGSPVTPNQSTNSSDPGDERQQKENAAKDKTSPEKQQAANELEYRRKYDQKQVEIQERIADLTGSLVIIGAFQVGVAVIGLGAIIVAYMSVQSADRGLRAVERPWLSITVEPKYTPKAGPHDVVYVITNGGKTPAILKQLHFFLSVSDHHLHFPGGPAPEQIPEGKLPTVANIFPAASHAQVMKTHPVPIDQINAVNEETMFLIIHGVAFYDDVFGERHLSRFYQVYSKELKGFIFPRDADPRLNEIT